MTTITGLSGNPGIGGKMKRLPIIRHIRYFYLRYRVNQHYDFWGSVGMLPVHAHRDYAVLDQIWRGER
jgi:hypothetical protein